MTTHRSLPPPLIPLLLAAFVAPVAFAGCAAPAAAPSPGSRQEASPADSADPSSPLPWDVGQWLQYEVKAGTSQAGKVNAVFDGERFIADRRPWALEEATRDVPILGSFDPVTLASTAFGHPWRPLDLPLSDGKRWTATLPIPDEYGQAVAQPVEFEATAGTVFLPGRQEPGFTIEGRVGGGLSVETSYSPSLHLPTYIRLRPPGANETTWDALLREDGRGWTGPVWSADSRVLVADHALVAPNEADPTAPYADPALTAEFPGPEADATVFGYLVAVALAGATHLELVDPAGKAVASTGLGAPFGVDVRLIDTPGKPGTWKVAGVGAGVVAFSAAYLWAVDLRQSTMGDPGGGEPVR